MLGVLADKVPNIFQQFHTLGTTKLVKAIEEKYVRASAKYCIRRHDFQYTSTRDVPVDFTKDTLNVGQEGFCCVLIIS